MSQEACYEYLKKIQFEYLNSNRRRKNELLNYAQMVTEVSYINGDEGSSFSFTKSFEYIDNFLSSLESERGDNDLSPLVVSFVDDISKALLVELNGVVESVSVGAFALSPQ